MDGFARRLFRPDHFTPSQKDRLSRRESSLYARKQPSVADSASVSHVLGFGPPLPPVAAHYAGVQQVRVILEIFKC